MPFGMSFFFFLHTRHVKMTPVCDSVKEWNYIDVYVGFMGKVKGVGVRLEIV